ncbi:hypothetical protein ACWDR9_09645 [Streptosporangium sandarakinum]|uniref:hypothetical protein n=1 Tax=Streptosporangium sandarakinum TaxID=1260955 RepID=UPI0036AB9DDA
MPRFKKKHLAAPTLNYTRRGFRLKEGRLHLAGGIAVTVVWSRDLPAEPSSVRIHRDPLGHWYASFVVPAQAEELPATGRAIGIDWGDPEVGFHAQSPTGEGCTVRFEDVRHSAERLADLRSGV